ncbi:hypothetical protein [Bacillus piscicola]|uniref:hypothetical protein n=1 Tax=Bacillus piscicola TaxID=1632684 RepID=UPI001F094341|nr:hypothetical protein [Bacillus piscicola]
MMKWLIYIFAFSISILSLWKGREIWNDDKKGAGVATMFLGVSIVSLIVILINRQ